MGTPRPSGVGCNSLAAFLWPGIPSDSEWLGQGLWIVGRRQSEDLGGQFAAHEDLRW